MLDVSCNWENISIYYTNLSPVYLCSSVLTVVTLFLTWWFTKRGFGTRDIKSFSKEGLLSTHNQNEDSHTTNSQPEDDSGWDSETRSSFETANIPIDHSLMKHIKTARQTAIEKQLTAGLSEEQLAKERQIQASQLEAIYKLLKEKEDQFQIRSMDELQEQLKLYKD